MSVADRQLSTFETGLIKAIDNLQSLILLNAKSGYLFSANADARIRYAPELYNGIVDAIAKSGYYEVVQDLVEKDKEFIDEVKKLRAGKGLPTGFSASSGEALAAFQNMELAQFRAIGDQFANSLHVELMNFAISGTTELDFINALRSKLDDSFKRYAVTYANTSRAQFSQQVENEAAKNYDGALYWEYSGPDDGRTRDACLEGLAQRYFTDLERREFEMRYSEERAWNCRHVFFQITEDDYKEGTK